nr:cysteine protease ATG4C isoform X2 [Danio rerio]|eukprot:XP_021332507.1 cysteine protease ATG4C isoform X2 [Danio rerio]
METKGTDEVETLKSKFMSAWHSVKYSWALKSKTAFSRNSPVFLLGKCYHFKVVDDENPTESTAEALDDDVVTGNVDEFRKDFTSRVWLTYREEFPALPGSSFTSDCGWGCTLRAGQMILAQALLLHILGRDWKWSEALSLEPLDTETWTSSAARRLVATLEASIQGERAQASQPLCPVQGEAEEADSYLKETYHRTIVSWFGDGPSAQLGIYKLVELGMTSGKQAGDWYGPAVVAHILRKAVDEAVDAMLKGIRVYVAQDCTDDSLIYMDPHYCQSFVDVSTSDFPLQSFHCPSPKKMSFSKMDPSCTIGFYSKSVEHFEKIANELSKILQPSSKEKYPAFTIMKGHGKDYELSIAVEKREWPFIRDARKAGTTSGDFVLL